MSLKPIVLKWIKTMLISLAVFFAGACYANTLSPPTLKVGVYTDSMPIAGKIDQTYSGVGVDLFKDIAKKNKVHYRFYPIHDAYYGIELTRLGLLDVLIGPYEVNHNLIAMLDYSTPYFINSVSLFINKPKTSYRSLFANLWTPLLAATVVWTLIFFITFCLLLWFFERHHSEEFRQKSIINRAGAVMWAIVSSFLRDLIFDPKTGAGRIVMSLWLVCSVVFMTVIASSVTSSIIKISALNHSAIKDPGYIMNTSIGVLENTSSVDIAKRYGAHIITAHHFKGLFKMLKEGKVTGVIADSAEAEYYMQHQHIKEVMSAPFHFQKNMFAFVMPEDSQYLHNINYALVNLQHDRVAEKFCALYLNNNIEDCAL